MFTDPWMPRILLAFVLMQTVASVYWVSALALELARVEEHLSAIDQRVQALEQRLAR
jgi:CHASE1-domain containing sensor protein